MNHCFLLVVLALLSACGSYVEPVSRNGDGNGVADNGESDDAAGPDAGVAPEPEPEGKKGAVTLSQSISATPVAQNIALCQQNTEPHFQTENSYYRVFSLPAFDVLGDFQLSSVRFAVSSTLSETGQQPVDVRVHTLAGPLQISSLQLLAQTTVQVADQSLSTVEVPLTATVPAGSTLVVEIHLPDGRSTGNRLMLGSNGAGQTGQSYFAASECGYDDIVDLAAIGAQGIATAHLIIEAAGTAL